MIKTKRCASTPRCSGSRRRPRRPSGSTRRLTVVSPEAPGGPGTRPGAGRPSRCRPVQGGTSPGRNPVYLVRSGRRRAGRVRAATRPRGAVHPGAGVDGAGDDRSLGLHLRKPHPNRRACLIRRSFVRPLLSRSCPPGWSRECPSVCAGVERGTSRSARGCAGRASARRTGGCLRRPGDQPALHLADRFQPERPSSGAGRQEQHLWGHIADLLVGHDHRHDPRTCCWSCGRTTTARVASWP